MIYLVNSSSSNYYINEIDKQFNLSGKYVYIVDGQIDVSFNERKMNLAIKINVANNFFLPNDFLKGNLILPSQEINSISFINTYKRPGPIIGKNWPATTYIYMANIFIDLTDDNFLGNNENKSVQMNLGFSCDTSSLNKDNTNIDAKVFQEFISELEKRSLNFLFNLKSSVVIKEDLTDYFEYSYTLKSNRTQIFFGQPISFKLPKYSDRNLYIHDLFEVIKETNDSEFEIEIDKLIINYSKDGKRKEISCDINEKTTFNNNFQYSLNNWEIYWEPKTNEPIFQKGVNGINFPFDTFGYYKIGFYLKYYNRSIYYEAINEFTYKNLLDVSVEVEETSYELISDYKQIYEN